MALTGYLNQVASLLDDFGNVEYTQPNLITYINDARVQVALAAECIRQPAQFALVQGVQSYLFSAATFVASPAAQPIIGLAGVANVRSCRLVLFSQNPQGQAGQARVPIRSWEWFEAYYLASNIPKQGPPVVSTRLQPGITGTLWIASAAGGPPDQPYTLNVDAVAYPIPLADDTTAEALPKPWTEAVQYYAAYLALLNAQRNSDADAMFARYEVFERRGTQMTTPSRNPSKYPGGQGAQLAGQKVPLTAISRQGGG